MKIFSSHLIKAIITFLLVFIFMFFAIDPFQNEFKYSKKNIDTVFTIKKPTKEFEKIPKKEIEKPISVVKFKKSKEIRDSIIKDDVIVNILVKNKNFLSKMKIMEVTRIDTAGIAYKDKYEIGKDFNVIEIDRTGKTKIKRRKKILPKILIIGGSSLAVFITGTIIYNHYAGQNIKRN